MSVRIITDSASDLTPAQARAMSVDMVCLKAVFPDGEYRDGVDLTPSEFFEKLVETSDLPTTSQVTPGEYEAVFRRALQDGDDVVCITLSSELSGCYQSALVARELFDEAERSRIFVIDGRNATLGQQLLVEEACQMRNAGKPAGEIAQAITKAVGEVRLLALLDTLEYLKKGGRISATVALAGTLLSIKPVIEVEDGKVALVGKARGSKNGNNLLTEFIGKRGPIDFARPVRVAFSGLSDRLLRKYLADSKHLYEEYQGEIPAVSIGSVIGTHVGPGAIAVAFFAKDE